MAACGQSLEGFAQMQCWLRSWLGHLRVIVSIKMQSLLQSEQLKQPPLARWSLMKIGPR
jgi:hypothetical protein